MIMIAHHDQIVGLLRYWRDLSHVQSKTTGNFKTSMTIRMLDGANLKCMAITERPK